MKKQQYNTKAFGLFIFIFTVIVLSIPLFFNGLPQGDDIHFHLNRIHGLTEGLKSGQFPVRIYPNFFNGYGYAAPLCYPDLFLYIPAFFCLLGISLELSYKIFIFMIIIATYCSMYYCTKKISNHFYSSIISAIIYSLTIYHFTNLYKRGALGESLACIFVPIAIWGVFNLCRQNFSHPLALILGFTGLFYSNTIICYCMVIITIPFVIIYFPAFLKEKRILIKLTQSIAITFFLCVSLLLPLLEQVLHQPFNAFYHPPQENFIPSGVSPLAFFLPGIFYNSPDSQRVYYLFGCLPLLLCFLTLLTPIRKSSKNTRQAIAFFTISGLGVLLLSSSFFPWQQTQFILKYIQFSWRFFSIAPAFLAITIGLCVKEIVGRDILQKYVTLSLLVGFSLWALLSFQMQPLTFMEIPDFTKPEESFHTGAGEWIPWGTETHSCDGSLYTTQNSPLPYKKEGVTVTLEIPKTDYVDIPLLYYKGYRATLKTQETDEILPLYKNEKGHIRVDTLQKNGVLTITYQPTLIQTFSLVASLMTLLGLLCVLIYKRAQIKVYRNFE